MKKSRRMFIRETLTGTAALAAGGILPGFSAMSYRNISGANDIIRIAVMGVNSRGLALAKSFAVKENVEVVFICDVDRRATDICTGEVEKLKKKRPAGVTDFRKALDSRDVDALVVAAPDHWHAPAAILAAKAGKHVYLEKPCSHSPAEGEMLVEAVNKYKVVMQMGNQRRSFPNVVAGINDLKNGVIGRPYFAKTWYTNNRPSIGTGRETAVPEWLDYELWQGPAPRKPFRDNLIHYNWHWFWHWGTGEALNNGTHEIDVIRWGLGVDYPLRVNSVGGRYYFKDDWETPDTQIITFDCPGETSVIWEGRSCNSRLVEGEDRGVIFYGEGGSMTTGGNSYIIYDKKNKVVKEVKSNIEIDGRNTLSPSEGLDVVHFANFVDAIRDNKLPNADVETGYKSTLWVQLGNIAQRVGYTLNIDQHNGHILDNPKASKLWRREYEKGWEPKI